MVVAGGTTLGGTVSAITVYNGELVVGGSFSAYVGGTLIQYPARFDGHAWSPVGTGVNGTVNALATYNGELIVGGYLWSAGGVSVGNIARWNGANWAPLVAGEGPNGPVYALAEDQGALMVGGSFWSAGNVIAGLVARWNGSGAWSGLRNGLNRQGLDDFVFDFSILDGDLVASGRFPPNSGHSSGLVDWARWACSTSPNQAPIAYAGGPFSGLRGHWMSFNGNASSDPDADLLRYEWDFGDGSTATMLSALASHSYATTGIFTLTLVVHDGELASAPYTTTVTITAPNVAPTVTLTNPAPGAAFTAPATIALAATASDSDGSVTEVEFFNDTISLGIDTSAPYGITWSNVQAGRYTIIARARDNNGAVSTSSATVTVDTLVQAAADAYVRDGSSANTNFGSATSLEVRTSGTGNNRWTYLRFDTTGLTSIGSARLRLFGSLSATALMSIRTAVYGASNTTWGEPTLTWNNKPASGSTALASVTMANSTTGRVVRMGHHELRPPGEGGGPPCGHAGAQEHDDHHGERHVQLEGGRRGQCAASGRGAVAAVEEDAAGNRPAASRWAKVRPVPNSCER